MSDQKESFKYKFWVMTIMSNSENILPDSSKVESVVKTLSSSYVCQLELGDGGMLHYQCAIETKIRKRHSTLLKDISTLLEYPEFLIQIDRSQDWEAAKLYCSAVEKRVEGSLVLTNIAQEVIYNQEDIKFLDDKTKRYPWQDTFMSIFFDDSETTYKPCDGRSIHWFTDTSGLSGKSTWCKWLHCRYPNNTKISFGSATQIRTSVVEKGPKQMYFLDIPRTLGVDDHLNNVYAALEDILNGYVETSMHGNPRELLMLSPHVIVFSNGTPNQEKLSSDRWKIYSIDASKELIYFHVL